MLCLVFTLIGSIYLSISTVAFSSGFIYSNESSKCHEIPVVLPSHYLDSQDEASVEVSNHITYTNTNRARALLHLFCFLEAEIIYRLPVNYSPNYSIEIFVTLTEHAQGRHPELVI